MLLDLYGIEGLGSRVIENINSVRYRHNDFRSVNTSVSLSFERKNAKRSKIFIIEIRLTITSKITHNGN